MNEAGDSDIVVFSNAFDEAIVNEQSAGDELQSARFATSCFQHCYKDGCCAKTRNATFLS